MESSAAAAGPRGPGHVLVALCGPPAVGKLTVATRLAELTDYRVFHNHLTLAPMRALFPGDEYHLGVSALRSCRLDLLDEAMRHSRARGVILTYTYGIEDGQEFLDRLAAVARGDGWRLFVVAMAADTATLLGRVGAPHRAALGKTSDPARLKRFLARDPGAPRPTDLAVRTDTALPPAVAEQILDALAGLEGRRG